MHAVLSDPLDEVVPPAWDEFADAGRAPAPWRAAMLTAAAWMATSRTVLGLVHDGATPVAAFHARFLGPSDIRRYARPGVLPVAGLVECRLHPPSLPGYRFAAELDDAGRTEAVAAFERAVRRRFRWRVGGFAYRNVEAGAVAALRRRPGVVLPVTPDLLLANAWPTMEEYLRGLPSKWRSQLRKIRATLLADPALRGELCDTVPAAQAARLVAAVRSRRRPRGHVQPPIPAGYFELLNADPGTRFAAYTRGDELLAMSTVHDTGTELVMTYWGGRDRTDGGLPNLYFDQYLRMIEEMITAGRSGLRPGKGVPDIKMRFGAKPEPHFLVAGR